MQATNKYYSFTDSIDRIDEILTTSDAGFEELNSIPSRDKLTHANGFYVNCSCVFIDIRNSSGLTEKLLRPTLARIYRSFISECVALINSNADCREVNIHGDAVWGVMDTPYKSDIDSVFSTVAQLTSLIDILNCRLKKKKALDPISVGIGMDYGRALMIKAGHKGSTINDVVWMGEVVNRAAKLASYGSRTWSDSRVMVSSVIYENLNDHNRGLLTYNSLRYCYHGSIINVLMDEWLRENCG
jgi:class 3 adenylate cyclase